MPLLAVRACFLIGLMAAPASAADDRTFLMGGALSMPQVTGENVVATAGTMDFQSVTVENLFAAGGTLTLNDVTAEHVFAAGGTVSVKAQAVESAHLAGGNVTFAGKVQDGLDMGGGLITVSPGTEVGGDVHLEGGNVNFSGKVGGDIRIESDVAAVSGEFSGDAVLEARRVTIAPGTVIKGDLSLPKVVNFTMPEGVTVAGDTKINRGRSMSREGIKVTVEADEEAQKSLDDALKKGDVDGKVSAEVKRAIREAAHAKDAAGEGSKDDESGLISPEPLSMSSWLTVLLTLAACGALALGVAPQFVAGSAQRLAQAPLESLLIGLASLVAAPLALVAIGITIVGIPFAVLGAAAYAIGIGLGLIALCLWGGLMVRTIANQPGEETRLPKLVGWTMMGFLVLAVIGAVPVLGRWIQILAVMAGAGAVLATAWHNRKQRTTLAA